MVTEPQGVLELMAQTEAAWEREIAARGDAADPERTALRDALAALRAEYAEADYPRREAIQDELRNLIRRHEALPGAAAEAPDEAGEEAGPVGSPGVERVEAEQAAARAVSGPVPHGYAEPAPEAGAEVPPPPAAEAGPARGAARPEGPVPHGYPGPAGARRETGRARGGQPGPVPHGYPGPGGEGGQESPPPIGEPAAGGSGAGPEGGPRRAWDGVRASALRWAAVARLDLEHAVLGKKRETRLLELGVRVWQLGERDALGEAGADAGVRARLRQVEQVEAAMRDNRERRAELRDA